MIKRVFGRGHKAPYETTHVRIPAPIKEEVEAIAESYRANPDPGFPRKQIGMVEAVELAKQALKSKKSAKQTMVAFLKLAYGLDLSNELK